MSRIGNLNQKLSEIVLKVLNTISLFYRTFIISGTESTKVYFSQYIQQFTIQSADPECAIAHVLAKAGI